MKPDFNVLNALAGVKSLHKDLLDDRKAHLPEGFAKIKPSSSLPVVILGSNYFAFFLTQSNPRINVVGIVNEYKKGEAFEGFKLLGNLDLAILAQRYPDLICISIATSPEGREFFTNLSRDLNLRTLSYEQALRFFEVTSTDCPYYDFRNEDFSGTVIQRFEEYLPVAGRLADDYSRFTFYSLLAFYLTGNYDYLMECERSARACYFQSGLFGLSDHESLVDVGATDGDVVRKFISLTRGRFDKVWCLEPDRANFESLKNYHQSLHGTEYKARIELLNVAASHESSVTEFFADGGLGSHLGTYNHSSSYTVQCTPLDQIIQEPCTFIKMDVEGHEENVLLGSKSICRKMKPKLAVCAYHRADDLIRLTQTIQGLNPEYKIGLRQHGTLRYDHILYAW